MSEQASGGQGRCEEGKREKGRVSVSEWVERAGECDGVGGRGGKEDKKRGKGGTYSSEGPSPGAGISFFTNHRIYVHTHQHHQYHLHTQSNMNGGGRERRIHTGGMSIAANPRATLRLRTMAENLLRVTMNSSYVNSGPYVRSWVSWEGFSFACISIVSVS